MKRCLNYKGVMDLEQLAIKTVIEYKYDNYEEAERHKKLMKSQGWSVESEKNYFVTHFRSYYKKQKEGSFL
jgi:hypothetical protein